MKLLKILFQRINRIFKKPTLTSREEVHWVNHICDEFIPPPTPAVQWYNLHGFDEGPGVVYWVGLDCRNFGIRSADYVIRCKTKVLYDEYVEAAHDGASAFCGRTCFQEAYYQSRCSTWHDSDFTYFRFYARQPNWTLHDGRYALSHNLLEA